MQSGVSPESLLDRWIVHLSERGKDGQQEVSDTEVADVILDFFFAAQDATTSGLVSVYVILVGHTGVLEKLREEHMRVRGWNGKTGKEGGFEKPLDGTVVLREMVFARKVVREVLRVRWVSSL
jgi:cytochrome P450 family 710 subfamily A protein